MKRLILSIYMIVLPLIAATQKPSQDSESLKRLDSLRIERRLIVLAVTKMAYLQEDNGKLCLLNAALLEKNHHNESYIGQLEKDLTDLRGINKGLNEGISEEINKKKTWRNIALVEGGLLVITLALFL